ncbi:MAG: carboxypeptidase regulatory-like domain-containing protein [Paludibacteraceae bacterium]|nr:carboxypeptidase regulatory-like domain-containing protein [Paludibacteraceae bacterium]
MRNKLFSLMAVLMVAVCAVAQTSLKGRVIDESSQEPVVGAKVTLANQNISTTTNAAGEFTLLYLEATDEEVIIEAEGYMAGLELINLKENQLNQMDAIRLQQNIVTQAQDEILLNLTEEEMSDDEGRSQQQASSSSASTDVFNANTSFAWSTARYRNRGYQSYAESYYIEGLNFTSQERGQFNYSAMGGLNDASRYKEVLNPLEATNFSFGGLGQSTNYLMGASRYAQGWKVGAAGTNRNYKARINATYASGVLPNGWAFIGQLAYRFSPYVDNKGIIGEGIKYYSLGYFFSAEKIWDNARLKLITFGAPTERGQNAAVTQEVYDLTGSNNYNPYWGYQNGKVRNSRIVKSYDPSLIAAYEHKFNEKHWLKVAAGYHYSMYSNSALTFYNAPDPRPDYYRNLPSFLWDGQIANPNNENSAGQLFDDNGNHYPWGLFIGEDMKGTNLGSGFIGADGNLVGPSVDQTQYDALVQLWQSRDNKTTQIDWDNIYAANLANNYTDPNGSARYMLERRHNDLQELMASVNYVNTAFDHLKMTVGAELKYSQGIHYKTIDDLLGGNQWIDIDAFADRDIKELATNSGFTQEDISNVRKNEIADDYNNVIKADGRHFGYDYRINMQKANIWFQNEWTFNEVDLYYAIAFNYSSMQRTTNMLNGRAWYLTKVAEERTGADAWKYYGHTAYNQIKALEAAGKLKAGSTYVGDIHTFLDPAFKLGANYKINGRNHLKLNALAETRAPFARDAYISQRVHDRVVDNIYTHDKAKSLVDFYAASERVVSADLTYEFNYPIVRGRVTGFFTQSWNGTELNGYYDDEARTFVNQAMTGIDKRYMGIEAALAVKMGTYFTLTGVTSIGDYRYTSDATAIQSAENGMPMTQNLATQELVFETMDKVLLKGLKLSTGPQLNASLKLSFFHPKMWFADVTVSYHDWNYLSVAPSRRMQGLYTGRRLDGTSVNGWFGDSYANAIQTTDNTPLDVTFDADGNPTYNNAVLDENGVPVLKYPYNIMTMQESLAATNPLNRFLIDASVGKLIYLPNRQSVSINLSVTNLTNNTHFKTGGYQQARLPRAVRQGEKDYRNSVITANAWKYPSKYYYAWGANFFLTVTYKF